MTTFPRALLLLDSGGALAAGLAVSALAAPVAGWYGLPVATVSAIGAANLVYGVGSGALAAVAYTRGPPLRAIRVLAAANVGWGLVCGALLWRYRGEAGALGLGHLLLEGLYVAGLGVVEAALASRR